MDQLILGALLQHRLPFQHACVFLLEGFDYFQDLVLVVLREFGFQIFFGQLLYLVLFRVFGFGLLVLLPEVPEVLLENFLFFEFIESFADLR